MKNTVIYVVTEPDGDRTAFDTEDAAKKYAIKMIKKYDMLDDGYINYIRNLMKEKPNTTPLSYNAYIDQIANDNNELAEFDFFIEDLIVLTEDDIP